MSFSTFFVLDGELTTAGYAFFIALAVILVLATFFLAGKKKSSKKISVKQLAFCGVAIALADVASFIKLFGLPYGGSVTLFSMLFICLIGNWYGTATGILAGLAYGTLQFLQDPIVLTPFQVCCDYILAFGALGLAGVFSKSKYGLLKGYILAIFARGLFHTIGGYLYWMDIEYIMTSFPSYPKKLIGLYPIIYNYSYILAEGIITVVVILLPPVVKALKQVKQMALQD